MTVPKTSVTVELKGQTWTLQVVVKPETLELELMDQSQHHLTYEASLSHSYIEQITKKTGNYKKFSVFVEMLLSGLETSDGPVSFDLLTPQDILLMRKEKGSTKSDQKKLDLDLDKIYLVMTYVIAFDRVHYPIPLMKVKEMSGDQIKVLKSTLSKQMAKMTMILKENEALKKQLESLSRQSRPDKSFYHLLKVHREMESELRLIERHGTNPVVQSCTYRLRQLLTKLSETGNGNTPRRGPLSRNRSTSQGRSPGPHKQSLGRSPSNNLEAHRLPGSRRASQQRASSASRLAEDGVYSPYKVIRSQPLTESSARRMDPRSKSKMSQGKKGIHSSRSQSRESLQSVAGYSQARGLARQRSSSANSGPSALSKRQSSFTRFDPTEYVRTRERSMEERRRKSLPRTNVRDFSPSSVDHRSFGPKHSSPNIQNPPRRPLYETRNLGSSTSDLVRHKSKQRVPLLDANGSIDTRLEEIHRILQSAIL